MANNNCDTTGVLIFTGDVNLTPVIKGLFGTFELDGTEPGGNQAYVAIISQSTNSHWAGVAESIATQQAALGIEIDADADEDDVTVWLRALADKFKVNDEQFTAFLDGTDFDCDADFNTLFDLAKWFDDGHGLKAISLESAFTCDRPRLFEFGGFGQYLSARVQVDSTSRKAGSLGSSIDAALEANNLVDTSSLMYGEVKRLLASILDDSARQTVASFIGEQLTNSTAEA